MEMTDLILKYLANKSEVKITGFGVFKQKDIPARFDQYSLTFLLPAKEFFFTKNSNLEDQALADFIATQENISLFDSYHKIRKSVDCWKRTFDEKKFLELPGLGTFFILNDELTFKGKRIVTENPENFGLEEVNLKELNNKLPNLKSKSEKNYKTSKNKMWWLFFIIPTAVIVYYANQNPELIFGKKSFENLSKIKTNPHLKKNTLKGKNLKTDSISLKNNANAQK